MPSYIVRLEHNGIEDFLKENVVGKIIFITAIGNESIFLNVIIERVSVSPDINGKATKILLGLSQGSIVLSFLSEILEIQVLSHNIFAIFDTKYKTGVKFEL